MQVKNKHDVSAHMVYKYNTKIRDVFFNKQKSTCRNVEKNGITLQKKAEGVNLPIFKKILTENGYNIVVKTKYVYEPKKIIEKIHIDITRIRKGRETVEILVLVRGKDMRTVINNCDTIVAFIKNKTGINIEEDAKLWTRQEMC